ncbi:tRNA lysidine(34) synthetase TilS [Nitratireductor sp. GISD-1A_MAKvit]|uniref:tRNA lysidine(34) synthetase TilS n=1 Tax=Nitratireductor sp. GISD-1A_MAKvit TaxID=3234198 RepID=UPI00346726A1
MPAADTVVLPDRGRLFTGYAFDQQSCVIAAVSGGGDSLALLLLLKDFLKTLPDAPRLLAVTVNHALRPEAAGEADYVARLCGTCGIDHRVVTWRGEKPATGISAAARSARLSLLATVARETGAGLVFTGHTRDDQAETVAMRAERGTGRGSAGIAPATLHEGQIWFARPLLRTGRAELRAFLTARDLRWIDDPSNDDRSYERVRTRQAMTPELTAALVEQARAAARERVALGEQAARLIDRHSSCVAPGLYRVSQAVFENGDDAALLYALRVLAAMVGGAEQLPSADRLVAVPEQLRKGICATLSRAVMVPRAGAVYFHRERRNLPSIPGAGHPFLWDGRYRLSADAGVVIAPFGTCGRDWLPAPVPSLPQTLLFSAQFAEPALWREGVCLGPARNHADGARVSVPAPWARLLPSFDIALANALKRLIGDKTVLALP